MIRVQTVLTFSRLNLSAQRILTRWIKPFILNCINKENDISVWSLILISDFGWTMPNLLFVQKNRLQFPSRDTLVCIPGWPVWSLSQYRGYTPRTGIVYGSSRPENNFSILSRNFESLTVKFRIWIFMIFIKSDDRRALIRRPKSIKYSILLFRQNHWKF